MTDLEFLKKHIIVNGLANHRSLSEEETEFCIDFLTRKLFRPLSGDDFLRMENGKLIHQERVLTVDETRGIITQAQALKTLEIYRLILNEMKDVAQKKIYFESHDKPSINFGKAILWTLDVLEKKIEKLSNL